MTFQKKNMSSIWIPLTRAIEVAPPTACLIVPFIATTITGDLAILAAVGSPPRDRVSRPGITTTPMQRINSNEYVYPGRVYLCALCKVQLFFVFELIFYYNLSLIIDNLLGFRDPDRAIGHQRSFIVYLYPN